LDPIRINVGANTGGANEDISQKVYVIADEEQKLPFLLGQLPHLVERGSVLIFASQKQTTEDIVRILKANKFHSAALHGDKDQNERNQIIFAFKGENLPILVATDIASRGLDTKVVKTVINFNIAKNIQAHIHRIGRTGRAGSTDGVAITLITKAEFRAAPDLVRNLEQANQEVTPQLLNLANQNPSFEKQRKKLGGGEKGGMGKGKGSSSSAKSNSMSVTFRKRGMGLGWDDKKSKDKKMKKWEMT